MQRVVEQLRCMSVAAALTLAMLSSGAAGAETSAAHVAKSTLETKIGMEGVCYARYRGGALEARPFRENSPITLSIGEVTSLPMSSGAPASIYELHFIATRTGRYDLRDYLVRVDGRPLADLEPLSVSIVGSLPKNYEGDLEPIGALKLPSPWPYRAVAIAVLLLWSLPAVWFLTNRLTRRRHAPPVRSVKPPTIADQLRPFVTAAIAGTLNAIDQARLESLLIGFWRNSLRLDGLPTQEALARMRRHAQAGELLRQLELWLYERPGRAAVDVAAILAPYENAATLPAVTSGLAAPAELPVEAGVS